VIDTLVLHYTGMPTAAEALARLLDPQAQVSAHYLIDEDGTVLHLVDEAMRAWHAGVSFWRGQTGLNARSIGIELVNPGHDWGYRPFPEPQMAATIGLARGLLARHPIAAGNVVGHSDIAPRRKADPGELFDWRRLAAKGIGLWPDPADQLLPMDQATVADLLARIGYETVDLRASLKALQRHFRPARVNGRLDFETARLLQGLAEICATS
jgi:N-acetylmuramoyl-L-alanine amidase